MTVKHLTRTKAGKAFLSLARAGAARGGAPVRLVFSGRELRRRDANPATSSPPARSRTRTPRPDQVVLDAANLRPGQTQQRNDSDHHRRREPDRRLHAQQGQPDRHAGFARPVERADPADRGRHQRHARRSTRARSPPSPRCSLGSIAPGVVAHVPVHADVSDRQRQQRAWRRLHGAQPARSRG